ncbi:MAG TPA: CDP-diacylglycerol diphosphatase [Caulobacteraceae bacterium]|nr:CDP-diacylglycerol diphosphatase [Caulobacteraceae bacterium]
MKFPSFRLTWLATALVLAALAAPLSACADPNTLWKIVHGSCAPGEAAKGDPSPCLAVDLKGGFAVLKDRNGATQVLLIPTDRVTGIEDPAVVAPAAPNYFEDAWRERHFVNALAGQVIVRDELSLAVNSMYGRSQNQLHIHVDCIRPDVRAALKANLEHIGPAWAPIDVGVSGRSYEAMRLAGEDLAGRNPFRLLAEGDPAARAGMGLETLFAWPTTFADGAPGFVLLADRASPGDAGSAEELQDHACKVLQSAG